MSIKNKLIRLLSKKKRITYPSYTTSSHVADYERIATELNSTPQHVYEIAHGKTPKGYDDDIIWNKLVDAEIVNTRK